MLDKPIDEIVCENGKVVGVKSGKEASPTDTATVKHLIVTHLLVGCSHQVCCRRSQLLL